MSSGTVRPHSDRDGVHRLGGVLHLDVGGDLAHGIEVFRHDLFVLHDNAEGGLEVGDELEDAGGVDEPGAEQGFIIRQPSRPSRNRKLVSTNSRIDCLMSIFMTPTRSYD